jgi:hypothetical protein
MRLVSRYKAALIFLLSVTAAAADDKYLFNERNAAHDAALFQSLDRNADGVVTSEESRGDLDFGPRFDDADINRDNKVTRQEFERYIEQRYGLVSTAQKQDGGGKPK